MTLVNGTVSNDVSADQAGSRRTRNVKLAALDYGIYVVLAALVVYFAFASPYFLQPRNLVNIASAVATVGIMAAGMTVAIIAGQIDLSIGAIVAVTSVVIAQLIVGLGFPDWLAILAGVAAALVIGSVNTILVAKLGINSIITTLATMTLFRGVAFILAGGAAITLPANSFAQVVTTRIAGIPLSVILMVVVYAVVFVLLRFTKLGAHIYATGGDLEAARRAGINTNRIFAFAFLTSAFLAAVSGIITTGMLSSAQGIFGTGVELSVLTGVLLGGIGLAGGRGRVERTLIGVLIVGVLANGLTLLNVSSFYQQLATGLVLVIAVIAESVRSKLILR